MTGYGTKPKPKETATEELDVAQTGAVSAPSPAKAVASGSAEVPQGDSKAGATLSGRAKSPVGGGTNKTSANGANDAQSAQVSRRGASAEAQLADQMMDDDFDFQGAIEQGFGRRADQTSGAMRGDKLGMQSGNFKSKFAPAQGFNPGSILKGLF